jgi:hypothetical protein
VREGKAGMEEGGGNVSIGRGRRGCVGGGGRDVAITCGEDISCV